MGDDNIAGAPRAPGSARLLSEQAIRVTTCGYEGGHDRRHLWEQPAGTGCPVKAAWQPVAGRKQLGHACAVFLSGENQQNGRLDDYEVIPRFVSSGDVRKASIGCLRSSKRERGSETVSQLRDRVRIEAA